MQFTWFRAIPVELLIAVATLELAARARHARSGSPQAAAPVAVRGWQQQLVVRCFAASGTTLHPVAQTADAQRVVIRSGRPQLVASSSDRKHQSQLAAVFSMQRQLTTLGVS